MYNVVYCCSHVVYCCDTDFILSNMYRLQAGLEDLENSGNYTAAILILF